MARKRRKATTGPRPPKPRRRWARNPVQRPHSTKHGLRGYSRRRAAQGLRRLLDQ